MVTKYEIDIVIKSIFSGMGFKQANNSLLNLSKSARNVADVLNPLDNFGNRMSKSSAQLNKLNMFKDTEMWASRAGLSIKEMTRNVKDSKGNLQKVSKLRFKDIQSGKLVGDLGAQKRIADTKKEYANLDKIGSQRARQLVADNKAIAESMSFGNVSKDMKEGVGFETLKTDAKRAGFEIQGTSKKMEIFKNGAQLTGKEAKNAFLKVGQSADKMRNSFDMNMMSVMFFGMAVQRLFTGLLTMGVGTFKELTKNNTEASNAITHLEANLQLLKFTIGQAIMQAIMPFMDDIVGVINKVTTWISENQELTAGILLIGAAIGSLMFIIGTLKLGLGGIGASLVKLSAGVAIPFTFTGLAIATTIFAGLLAAWETDLGGIQDFLKETFDGIFGKEGFLSNIFEDFKVLGKDFWNFLTALFGDDEKEFDKAVTGLLLGIGEILLKGLVGLGWLASNALKWVANTILDLLSGVIGKKLTRAVTNYILKPILLPLEAMDAAGVLGPKLTGLLNEIQNFQDSIVNRTADFYKDIPKFEYETSDEFKDSLKDINDMFDGFRESAGIGTEPMEIDFGVDSLMDRNNLEDINNLKSDGLEKDRQEIEYLATKNALEEERSNILSTRIGAGMMINYEDIDEERRRYANTI